MAGTLVITTLSDGTNSTSATNCIQGSAKAWVNYNGIGATIRGSYNVSSVTLNSAGDYTLNFTNALADTNYAIVATTVNLPGNYTMAMSVLMSNSTTPTLYSTTACRIQSRATDSSLLTLGLINAAVFR
jgi:hypothetical protein